MSVAAHDEALLKQLAPHALAAVLRRHGDFAAAEDAVQEALIAASLAWPKEGRPHSPLGWLIQVAVRRLTDQLRSDEARRRREDALGAETQREHEESAAAPRPPAADDAEDTLLLLFMCCHPALTDASAIALTLRAVAGLTTAELARAFLVPEPTMAQRISRAKQTIHDSKIPFRRPLAAEWRARLDAVLHVLYLLFNEGYTASGGEALHRADLTAEAIRLTREVHRSLRDDAEVAGLLALMLLTEARRDARTGPDGELVSLAEQDRSKWNAALIAEGVELITAALPKGPPGPYQLQAAIAAVHDEAPTAAETDWPQIFALYGVLESLTANPMVALNRAVALAMVEGPAAGLERLATLARDKRLKGNHRLDAVRAHLHELAGDRALAARHYRAAAAATGNLAERRYLLARAQRVEKAEAAPTSG